MFSLIEKFVSIDGEGPTAGRLAAFLRFQGCDLRCSWCDTTYSYSQENITQRATAEELYDYLLSTGVKGVTLTGGEPLLQPDLPQLLMFLETDPFLETQIETNGAVDITPYVRAFPKISFIVDYKLNGSGMTDRMCLQNLFAVRRQDAYKFVVSGREDLLQAAEIIKRYDLCEKTQVFFSPVQGKIEPKEIVDFMKEQKLHSVRLQLQLHKIIWDPEERGV